MKSQKPIKEKLMKSTEAIFNVCRKIPILLKYADIIKALNSHYSKERESKSSET